MHNSVVTMWKVLKFDRKQISRNLYKYVISSYIIGQLILFFKLKCYHIYINFATQHVLSRIKAANTIMYIHELPMFAYNL